MHDALTLWWPPRMRRAAVIAAAVLGLAAGALVTPAVSQAGVCSPGEFCMWSGINQTRGLYHFAGSDANLWNDRFENAELQRVVANQTRSWWNRGTSSGPAQVRVFIRTNGSGPFTCAPQNTRGNFGTDPATHTTFFLNVESFEWRSSC